MAIFEKRSDKSDQLHELMQYRVQDVLLVSSMYDAFLLAEDGRLSHRVFGDFMDLDLHHIPRITRVSSAAEALDALGRGQFDLVITMPRISDMSPFEFGASAKRLHPDLPVVLLTYSPVKSSMLKQIRKHKSIDKVFYWFGDSKIFLAIIKTVEDMQNLDTDVQYGVNVILVVEDSPWYYSSFLPMLYSEIINQTRRIVSEGVNDVQRMLRIRARPKIISAETYEEAEEMLEKYRDNLLGVISDVRYPKNGELCPDAGLQLVQKIREEVPDLNVVLQSSEPGNRADARRLDVTFINKNSPTLLDELNGFMLTHFGFGDFVFRMPGGQAIARASDMKQFAQVLKRVPTESLLYHTSRNHVSIWLRARTEFELAEMLRPKKISDFEDIEAVRAFLVDAIESSLEKERVGVISDFSVSGLKDEYRFARIGGGSLGGKARGVAFMNALIHRSNLRNEFPKVRIRTPMTFVLCTGVYEEFLKAGNLRDRAFAAGNDEQVYRLFRETPIPSSVERDLRAMLMEVRSPVAVRSSSLLEDSQSMPFSGIYKSYMLPNDHPDLEVRYRQLVGAIKMVYASVFSVAARRYVANTNFRVEEERMAVLIQRVVGNRQEDRFYPAISGVAQSYNYYPLAHLKPEDGVVYMALGLGKALGESNRIFRFSPANPSVNPGMRTPRELLGRTQKQFYALKLGDIPRPIGTDEGACLALHKLDVADRDRILPLISSVANLEDGYLDDSPFATGKRVINFSPLLKNKFFPFNDLISRLLKQGEQAVGTPVEIEFAVNLDPSGVKRPEFYFLQLRPLVAGDEFGEVDVDRVKPHRIVSRSNQTMGNGVYDRLFDLVYVRPDAFSPEHTREIAREIGELNLDMQQQGRQYILMGFGRWGTSDRGQGIPVDQSQISQAKVLVESNLGDFKADASRGNHFFQHMLANKVGYFYVSDDPDTGTVAWDWLEKQPVHRESRFLRHLRFRRPVIVKIDGRSSRGVMIKPLGRKAAVSKS